MPDTADQSQTRSGLWWRVLLAALLIVVTLTRGIDDPAEDYFEQAFTRALVTFGLARALNGVISVVQGTEVAVHPAGLGLNFAPGQLVDPLNDLVERFSWIMLVASTSLGMQKILMDISSWWGIQLIVVIAASAWLVLVFRRQRGVARQAALRLFLLALFLRLAMPLMVTLNHAVYDVFMAEDYDRATQVIESTSAELEALQRESEAGAEAGEDGWLSSMRAWLDDTAEAVNVRQQLEDFQQRLSLATEHLLKLAAVFILQTAVLPLLFLWAFARGLGGILRAQARPGS